MSKLRDEKINITGSADIRKNGNEHGKKGKNADGARKRKRSISQRFLDSVDLPQHVNPFIPETVISISENMTLNVSSCKKILCYTEDSIRLLLGRYELEVNGSRLFLKSCLNKSLELTGIIDSVRFIGRK